MISNKDPHPQVVLDLEECTSVRREELSGHGCMAEAEAAEEVHMEGGRVGDVEEAWGASCSGSETRVKLSASSTIRRGSHSRGTRPTGPSQPVYSPVTNSQTGNLLSEELR